MVYFCADDYGLCDSASVHIQQCIDAGILNKVSVFPNFDIIDFNELKNVRVSLHLNLVEGKCMADAGEIGLLADENGDFKHQFGGLLKLNLFHKKKFEEQIYKEIKAQVLFWKNNLPQDWDFCVDSHQHTHMIPAVFKALVKVLNEEKIDAKYIRIPAEPVLPYLKTPSLYFTYSAVNIIKQWLLRFLWRINKVQAKKYHISESYFLGILFSGKMDEKRIRAILPKYIKMAEKDDKDIEVLFHPGYLEEKENIFINKNVVFEKFYLSENRKTEYDSVKKLTERRVL